MTSEARHGKAWTVPPLPSPSARGPLSAGRPCVATIGPEGGSITYELEPIRDGVSVSRVTHADDRLVIARNLMEGDAVESLGAGLYALDPGIGEYVYRVASETEDGRSVVCERVRL